MSDEAQRWKEKYLKSIEQQEKLERRWDARLDLLRRGLVRSTLAAEGTDRAVDQCMKEMREVVRTDDMDAGLAALLPRLEKAVLDSEQRRETRVNQTSAALTALVSQLQTLPLPREVSRPLKNFAKQLDARVGQAREIPLLLSELSGLQGKALNQLENTAEPGRPGLLQRLFGSREADEAALQVASATFPTPAPQPAEAVAVPHAETPQVTVNLAPELDKPPVAAAQVAAPATAFEPPTIEAPPAAAPSPAVVAFVPPVLEPERARTQTPEMQLDIEHPEEPAPSIIEPEIQAQPAINPDELTPAVYLDSLPLPPAMAKVLAAVDTEQSEQDVLYALPDSPEPSYSSVAKHIEDTLLGLLDDLTLPEHHRPQAEAMRDRLQNGLNWYELLPILDDLATLMLAINNSGQHEFEVYLQQLNERLESFQSNLQAASDGHDDNRSAARQMDTQIREQVDGLQSSMQDAADLEAVSYTHLTLPTKA